MEQLNWNGKRNSFLWAISSCYILFTESVPLTTKCVFVSSLIVNTARNSSAKYCFDCLKIQKIVVEYWLIDADNLPPIEIIWQSKRNSIVKKNSISIKSHELIWNIRFHYEIWCKFFATKQLQIIWRTTFNFTVKISTSIIREDFLM